MANRENNQLRQDATAREAELERTRDELESARAAKPVLRYPILWMRKVLPGYDMGLIAVFGLLDRTLGPEWVYALYLVFAWTVVSFTRNTAETVGAVYTTAVLVSGPLCWCVCTVVAVVCY